jgi:hypothetical protein
MGESVSVRYNPADPNEAQLSSAPDLFLFFIFGGLGGLLFLIGLIVEVIAVRNRYRPDTAVSSTISTDISVQYGTNMNISLHYDTSIDPDVPDVASIDPDVPDVASIDPDVHYNNGITMRTLLVVFCILLFFAITFFGAGVFILNQAIAFQSVATGKTTGIIVHCDEDTSDDTSNNTTTTSCSPTIRFVTREGRIVEFIPSESSSGFGVGQSMPVIYNPHAPEEARISSFSDLWLLPIVFLGVGSIFIILTGINGFFMQRRIFGKNAKG